MKKLMIITLILSVLICFTTKSDNVNELEKYRLKYSELVLKWENSTNQEERIVLEKQMNELKATLIQKAIKKYRSEYSDLVNKWISTDDYSTRVDIESKIEDLKTSKLHLFKR